MATLKYYYHLPWWTEEKHKNSLPKATSLQVVRRPRDLPTNILRVQSNGWTHIKEVMARPNVSSPST